MRKLFVLLFVGLLVPTTVTSAAVFWKTVLITASGGSPTTTSFDSGNTQSLIMTGISNAKGIAFVNRLGEKALLNCRTADAASPPADESNLNIEIPELDPFGLALDNVPVNSVCYLRTRVASTSGTFWLLVWGL